ncbi:polysaccharide biosynthesis/export family protein [Desulfogranum japonicum]|uniref:polysaccharide biosynthesis/export family protein n=1 Tax=Desulfogranum japonicum TaxID=231447 RepID=UPI00048A6819|nr:polysaccharide biosynthesis/export family protein [Desulfogranum japonicum]
MSHKQPKFICMKLTGTSMVSIIFLLLVVLSINGCSTLPSQDTYSVPLDHFGTGDEPEKPVGPQYTFIPRDTLNIVFNFNTIQDETYRIFPHDKLTIKFLSAPVYDDIYLVRPDGYTSLPLIGDLKVKGMTVEQLKRKLIRSYTNILNKPEFFVALAEYQVYLKEVRQSLDHPNLGLARQVVVRDDYFVTMPMIGEISVAGKSLEQLTVEANQKYGDVVPGMQVDILLQETAPREIYVFGEVKKPGRHQISKPVSLFTAIALAGGANVDGNLDTVLTLNKEGDEMVARICNFNELLQGQGQASLLQPDDIVYVPRTRLSSAAQTMKYVSDILLFRGVDISYTYRMDE